MNPHEPHVDVGAYVLGVLDEAERAEFERHLPHCARCTAECDELGRVGPLLADLAYATHPADIEAPRTEDGLLDRLVGQVGQERRGRRRRRLYAVAAAAVLIVGGPVAVGLISSGDPAPAPSSPLVAGPTGERFTARDAGTGAAATVGLEQKKWGTRIGLELKGVRGPLTCQLVAVSADGESQVVTSWAVPRDGYGTKEQPEALVTDGGSSMPRSEIRRVEVRTTDGERLLAVPV